VDDVLLAESPEVFDIIVEVFNSFHNRLQFTLEINKKNRLNFLNLTILIDEQRIVSDCYKKTNFSERYLNFKLQHPICHKKGVICNFFDRIILLSHLKFHKKNIIDIINVLKNIIINLLYFPLFTQK